MPHLDEAQLATLAFEPASHEHVESCLHCRRRLEELRDGLDLARTDEAPDPDPVTLARLHRGVMRRLEAHDRRRQLLMWPGLAAAAILAIATVMSTARAPTPQPLATAPAWLALPPIERDVSFAILEGVRLEQEQLESLGGCEDLASCLIGLNESERLALVGELRDDIRRREL